MLKLCAVTWCFMTDTREQQLLGTHTKEGGNRRDGGKHHFTDEILNLIAFYFQFPSSSSTFHSAGLTPDSVQIKKTALKSNLFSCLRHFIR